MFYLSKFLIFYEIFNISFKDQFVDVSKIIIDVKHTIFDNDSRSFYIQIDKHRFYIQSFFMFCILSAYISLLHLTVILPSNKSW